MERGLRNQNELAHYGIKDMKWGVRRFQNEDKSLTPEGRERYRKSANGDGPTKGTTKKKKEKPESQTWKSKDASTLSDEELNRRNSRLQRERQYQDLTTPQWKKDAKNIAKDAFKKIVIGTAVTAATAVVAKQYKDKITPFLTDKASTLVSNIGEKNKMKWLL